MTKKTYRAKKAKKNPKVAATITPEIKERLTAFKKETGLSYAAIMRNALFNAEWYRERYGE